MTRGLVLGKFAPLHRGHQLLIERALVTCDELVVLIYDSPAVTSIPLATRAGWIRRLYPQACVIEGRDGPAATGRDPAVMRAQEEYIRSVVPDTITHFFSSEWYGEHVSASLGAIDVRVDEARIEFAVSGTAIRRDAYRCRQHVHPLVYWDLIRRVVLLGAESTGKTTLAALLAREYGTIWVPEYGREYWERYHDNAGRLTLVQLGELAEGHRAKEEMAAVEANRLLFIDTDVRTTRQYARWYHGRSTPKLDALTEDAQSRYHLVVLCGDDIGYDHEPGRGGETRRREAQREIVAEVSGTPAPFVAVRGPLHQRVAEVRNAIERLRLLEWA